jgi:crotonobetainyl-CoA:carnitine CoA-transferase CaiB-like acyl-CoA transferase
MNGPLDGLRVLDLSRLAPGSYGTMILGDLGADVLIIEAPQGMISPVQRPVPPDAAKREAHAPLRRNKRSMVLNLKEPAGREVFHRLVREADVVMEGFRPGVMRRLGCDYETLAPINPRIILCSLSGYGVGGPYEQREGHDINYLAIAGFLGTVGTSPEEAPVIANNTVADYAGGGMQAAMGIMAAVIARHSTGRGQHVDISMTDGVMYLMANMYPEVLDGGGTVGRGTHWLNGGYPQYGTYRTKDGRWLSLGSLEVKFWHNLCRVMGMEQWQDQALDTSIHPQVREHLTRRVAEKTCDEWMALFAETEICAAPVLAMDEAARDPQVLARRMVLDLEHPQVGPVRQIGIGPKFSATPGSVRSFGPKTGAQTRDVLSGAGYTPAEIDALFADGVVQ